MKQPTIESKSKTEKNILSIKIDGEWTASDFTDFFNSILILYEVYKIIESNEKLNSYFFEDNVVSINGDLYYKSGFQKLDITEITPEQRLLIKIFGDKENYLSPSNYKSDLRILKLQYSSPGNSDFLGLGTIIKEVFNTFRYYVPNKAGRIKTEIEEQKLLSKKIQNLKAMGYTAKEIKLMIQAKDEAIQTLSVLDSSGKLVSAELKKLK